MLKRLSFILMMLCTAFGTVQGQEVFDKSRYVGIQMGWTPTNWQLRTNTLYWAALVPNIGVEVQANNGLAAQLDYIGAWWNTRKTNHYYSCYGLQGEVRYYLKARKFLAPYPGHHIGIYGQLMTYDFEFGGTGYQCRNLLNTIGTGISYGYVIPLKGHFLLDLTIGIGMLTSRYKEYIPTSKGYRVTDDKRITWWGPTRIEATLIYNFKKR